MLLKDQFKEWAKEYNVSYTTVVNIYYKMYGNVEMTLEQLKLTNRRNYWRDRIHALGEKYNTDIRVIHRIMRSSKVQCFKVINLNEDIFKKVEKLTKQWAIEHNKI